MLVRRALLDEIGGFDERFFLYCEDMDLCLRIHTAARRVVYVPEAQATHVGGASAPAGAGAVGCRRGPATRRPP